MKFEPINNSLQLIGNVGLIIGLLLVGYQIKQSNDIAFASLASTAYQQETDRWIAEMGENPAAILSKARLDPQSLSPEEVWVVTSEVLWTISMFRRNAKLEEVGIFTGSWRQYLAGNARDIGRNPVQKAFLFSYETDEDWLKQMQEIAAAQPTGGSDFQELLESLEIPTQD